MEIIVANRALPCLLRRIRWSRHNFPKKKMGFEYRYIMTYPRWNRALSWIHRAKAWDNGIGGVKLLLELTERLVRSQVQIYLFWLDTLARTGREKKRAELWAVLRERKDLTVRYRTGSPAARSEYVIRAGAGHAEVNFLWLCRAADGSEDDGRNDLDVTL